MAFLLKIPCTQVSLHQVSSSQGDGGQRSLVSDVWPLQHSEIGMRVSHAFILFKTYSISFLPTMVRLSCRNYVPRYLLQLLLEYYLYVTKILTSNIHFRRHIQKMEGFEIPGGKSNVFNLFPIFKQTYPRKRYQAGIHEQMWINSLSNDRHILLLKS